MGQFAIPGIIDLYCTSDTSTALAAGITSTPDFSQASWSAGQTMSAQDALQHTKATGSTMHLMGQGTAEELTALDGIRHHRPVSLSVSVAHLVLSEEEATSNETALFADTDRRTLWAWITRDRIHSVTSSGPNVALPCAEVLFPFLAAAVERDQLSLEQLVAMCAERPARLAGLDTKGAIEEGRDADIVLFREGRVRKVGPTHLEAASDLAPFVGRYAAPKPDAVYHRGLLVAQEGHRLSETMPAGRRLSA